MVHAHFASLNTIHYLLKVLVFELQSITDQTSVFLDRLFCRLRVVERVVLDWRRVCEIFVCVVMRYHVLPWSLSFR
jgi:hypothetical protein